MLQSKPVKFEELSDDAFVRLNELQAENITPFSSSTTWRKVKCREFPAPETLSSKITAWRVGKIRRWQADPTNYREQPNDIEKVS